MKEYVKIDDIMQFPIRRDHYDRANGNEHFINGIETVMEYIEQLPRINVEEVHAAILVDLDAKGITTTVKFVAPNFEKRMDGNLLKDDTNE